MKFKLIYIISLLSVCASGNIFAQDPNELILQMSQTYSGGTARMMGLGGGKVSLGGDAGNIYLNPAGLGFYNRSEFVFSPQFDFSYADTDYLNQRNTDSKLNFNIANMGIVFNKSTDIASDKKWRGGSFAFTLNRINDYHFNAQYFGNNANQDILTYAVNQDNFLGPTDFTDLFFNTFLTTNYFEIFEGQETININNMTYNVRDLYGDVNQGDTLFFVDRFVFRDGGLAYPTEEFPTAQREEIRSRGAQYAASFSYGGNYNDRFYFGFGLNLMSIDKEVDRIYTEEIPASDLNELILTDNYRLSGSGINASFGIIGRPLNNLLIGLSYTTPTYYAMEESQEIGLVANFTNDDIIEDEIIVPSFFYDVSMPSRIRGGVTYFFGKKGFISADVETSNTQNSQILNSGDFDFEENANTVTRNNFTQTISAGVGGEYRLDMFRLRAGFNYISDPSNAQGIDFNKYLFSLGAGIRKKNFFFDAAYTLNSTTQSFSPYPSTEVVIAPTAVSDISNNYITTTIGFTF